MSFRLVGLLTSLRYGRLPRDRLNVNCEMDQRPIVVHSFGKSSEPTALNEDVDIAIEVIMRSADAEHGRRYGYNAHGGYVEGGRFETSCRGKGFTAIARCTRLTPNSRNAGNTNT